MNTCYDYAASVLLYAEISPLNPFSMYMESLGIRDIGSIDIKISEAWNGIALNHKEFLVSSNS